MSLCALGLCVAMQTNTPESLSVPLLPVDATSTGTTWLSTDVGNGGHAHFAPPQQEPITMIAGIMIVFVWKYVLREEDKQMLGAKVRSWFPSVFKRPVTIQHRTRAQQGGRWAVVYLDVEGVDSDDEDNDPDYYLEWDEVDYDNDGRIDSTSQHARYATLDGVAQSFYSQLSYVDQALRQRRM